MLAKGNTGACKSAPRLKLGAAFGGDAFEHTIRAFFQADGFIVQGRAVLSLSGEDLVPDIAAWRRERLAKHGADDARTLTPDFVCDFLSAATRVDQHLHRVPAYARHAIRHVWLVDDVARRLEALKLHGSAYVSAGAWEQGALVEAEPFDGWSLDLRRLWAALHGPSAAATR